MDFIVPFGPAHARDDDLAGGDRFIAASDGGRERDGAAVDLGHADGHVEFLLEAQRAVELARRLDPRPSDAPSGG